MFTSTSNHSIRELVRAIFVSDEFFSQRARFALVKSPVETDRRLDSHAGRSLQSGHDRARGDQISNILAASVHIPGTGVVQSPRRAGLEAIIWDGSTPPRFSIVSPMRICL